LPRRLAVPVSFSPDLADALLLRFASSTERTGLLRVIGERTGHCSGTRAARRPHARPRLPTSPRIASVMTRTTARRARIGLAEQAHGDPAGSPS